ncbi:hypothetical protein [Sulfitobacter mediterraneus]|uniref:hypothetical protein n=1 Tax=Sulfitobacter mediterraneus TaxID=83219 RepID=UPI0021A5F82A|nr:hypothetical protein [Sulfitobacter mediterraneus]UWR10899.1 hypothetical protein K3753_16865 [Sulfitobacter mediterraneus]
MDITKFTLNEFLGDNDENVSAAALHPRDVVVAPRTGLQLQILKSHGDYHIVLINNCGDVAAVDKQGNEAGYYSSNSLIVHEEHRGSGLGIALALHAHANRDKLPKSRSLTSGGRKTLKAAWDVANGNRFSPWWP